MIFNQKGIKYILKYITNNRDSFDNSHINLVEFAHLYVPFQHLFAGEKEVNSRLFFFVNKGQGTIFIEGELVGLKSGDLVVLDMEHNYYITSHEWEITYVVLTGDFLQETTSTQISAFSINDPHKVEDILLSIFEETKNNHQFLVTAKSLELFHELYHNKKNTYNVISHLSPIQTSKRYIDNNFMNDIHIDDLAKKANFSKFYFIRLFHQQIGKTPYQYIIDLRISHAKYLLKRTTMKIKEIAKDSGFNGETNFIYTFKNEVGVTPLNYRKKEV